jgi:WD40 repeat protein
MSLAPGFRLGQYEITTQLGAGGMGEVYKARDTRLQRSVAIKILPSSFATDPERLARFEREAQVLASLNHPNIAHIYGVEETGGALALVMELVEGPTLAEVIAHHRPHGSGATRSGSWDIDPLAVARQLADALEAAHDQGIIHRDLKPQNIILRPDGTLKVLDFGLAKALDPVSGIDRPDNSPTITNADTRVGTLLGTAAYMAPEQVKGRAADRRADIWAFGAVLYELWTGTMAFAGDSTTEILARVIEREPDWSKLPADTPPAVIRLLHRALVKDPKRRLQSIGDARLDLDEAIGGAAAAAPGQPFTRVKRGVPIAAAFIVCGLLGVAAGRWSGSSPSAIAAPPIRASIALPSGTFLDGVGPPELALSRDGRTIAFLARETTAAQRLYVRALDSETATLVPGSDTAEGPFFSPDGRWVAFAVGVSSIGDQPPELRKYSLDTGLTQTITRLGDFFGGVWLDDGTIAFIDVQPSGLWMVNSAGGKPRQIAAKWILDGRESERPIAWPSMVPGSRSVVLTEWSTSRVGTLMVGDLDTRQLVNLNIDGSGGLVLPNGYLVYANASAALMAVRFDLTRRRVAGTPVALMPDIAFGRNNVPVFAVADNGTLAFAPGYLRHSRREPMQIVRISPAGIVTPLAFEPELVIRGFELSPDGNRLAVGVWDGSRSVLDLRRGTRHKLPSGKLMEAYTMAWAADGRTLAVSGPHIAGAEGWAIVVDALDGSSSETLISLPTREVFTAGWLPGGRTHIAWDSRGQDYASILRKDEGQPPQALLTERSNIRSVRISPNGRWLAYASNVSGPFHVYITSISGKAERLQVSPRSGEAPRWSHDGKQLFFRSGTAMMTVGVRENEGQIDLSPERKLFDAEMAPEYVVAPNGDFYTPTPVPGAAFQTHIQLRTGWFDEIDRLRRGPQQR